MKSVLFYLLLGLLAIVLRTAVFPLLLPPALCPDLLLGIVIYLGLSESMARAIPVTMLLGGMQDSFCGSSLGLYVFICLVILLLVRRFSEHLDVESPLLLLMLFAVATLVQQLLLIATLTIFADSGPVLGILLPTLPQQLLANLVTLVLLLGLTLKLQPLFGYRAGLAGLVYQSKRHGT